MKFASAETYLEFSMSERNIRIVVRMHGRDDHDREVIIVNQAYRLNLSREENKEMFQTTKQEKV